MATNELSEPNGVDAPEGKSKSPKVRRKPSAKTPTPEARRSLNLRIDEDSYQRLNVHALMRGTTVSELVIGFAQTHLREFVVHRRSASGSDGQG
jgi:hypothetical protein